MLELINKINNNMKKTLLTLFSLMILSLGYAQDTYWTPNHEGFESNMTIFALLEIDGIEQRTEYIEIGAFCGDECREAQLAFYDDMDDRYYYFITIGGASGDNITFLLYDHETQQILPCQNQTFMTVINDAMYGFDEDFFISFTTEIHNDNPGDWNDPETWGGYTPGPESSVVLGANCTIGDGTPATVTVADLEIPTGVTLTLEAGSILTITGDLECDDEDGFIIEDGAQVINESPNVKATAKKFIEPWTVKDSNGWCLISSEVDNMTIAGSDFLTETFDLYRYNETVPKWENYRQHMEEFTTFEDGRGYLYANNNPAFTPAFKGDLNYTDVVWEVTNSSSTKDVVSGINIIGNPFPHKIYKGVGGAINDNRLQAGFYKLSFYGKWEAYTYTEPIMPGEGILVITSETTDVTITKTNASATSETSTKGDVNLLRLNVEGHGSQDRAFAYFGEGNGLEKIGNYSSSEATIAFKHDGTDYAIAFVGEDCDQMDVVFNNTKNSDYTISFEGIEAFSYLHLIDKLTGEDVDMLFDNEYQFHANGNETADRFKVVCRDVNSIGENAEEEMFAYVSGNSIVVRGEGMLEIIDMTGRIVSTVELSGEETVNRPTQGVYVLRMINGNNVKTQKIIVK